MMIKPKANPLVVSFDLRTKAIQFILNGNLVYDIGIEFLLGEAQVDEWLSQLSEKRWFNENGGRSLFLVALDQALGWKESA